MEKKRGLIRFVLFALLGAGAASRLLSGTPILQTDLIYAPGRAEKIPGARNPESTAKSFYMLIDAGHYGKAYGMILEPDWTGNQAEVSLHTAILPAAEFRGWTSERAFVHRMERELGHRGGGIRLNGIEVMKMERFQDLSFLDLYEMEGLQSACMVTVTGHILGACSIFRWEKDLLVLGIDGKYKVLLEGTKEAKRFTYQTWFSNIERFKNIRG